MGLNLVRDFKNMCIWFIEDRGGSHVPSRRRGSEEMGRNVALLVARRENRLPLVHFADVNKLRRTVQNPIRVDLMKLLNCLID